MAKQDPSLPKANEKTRLLVGLALIIAAFVGVMAAFYLLARTQNAASTEAERLQQKVQALNTERGVMEKKTAELQKQAGTTISLNKLISRADGVYGEKEKDRREGSLWIDRKNGTMMVTLGALNGVTAGERLTVMQGKQQVGYVRVDMAMDVISYVHPVNKAIADFKDDYYNVKIENK